MHQAGEDANERRFAGTVGTDQQQALARLDLQVYLDQGWPRGELTGIARREAPGAEGAHTPIGVACFRASVNSRNRFLPRARSALYSVWPMAPAAKRSSSAAIRITSSSRSCSVSLRVSRAGAVPGRNRL